MPSLLKFLFVTSTAVGLVVGGLYLVSDMFEPAQHEVRSVVSGLKIKR